MSRVACFVLVCSIAAPATARAELRFELREGRLFGLLAFLEAAGGGPRGSAALRAAFAGSRFDDERRRALIVEHARLRERHLGGSGSHRFAGYPAARGEMGWSLSAFVTVQSALAADLADLGGRTAGLMPVADHHRLLALARELAPVYDELVWKPAQRRLAAYRKRLERIARRAGLARLFTRAARFYGASWPDDAPLRIVLHPIPGRRVATSAVVVEGTALVEALFEESDLEGRFGVIFHELCHSLYQAQPAALQHRLDAAFRQLASPWAPHAYRVLDEALATALGNGWAYRAAKGRLDAGAWYADPVVDRFARQLLSLVETYLERGWAIDEAFVKQAATAFKQLFPDAIREYAVVLREVVLATDGETFSATAGQALRRQFSPRGITSVSPIGHEETARTLQEAPAGAAVVALFTPRSQDQLRELGRYLPPLRKLHAAVAREQGDGVYSILDDRSRAWILIRLARAADLEPALRALKQARAIKPARPWLRVAPR